MATIGVCVRNSASTIRDTIDSISKQDFPCELVEIVFVDDGSEDRTLSILLDSAHEMDMQVKLLHGGL